MEPTPKAKAPLLLVVVHSWIGSWRRRAAVRASWAAADLVPEDVRVVFLVGTKAPEIVNGSVLVGSDWSSQLRDEWRQHGDILQEDFVDAYANLTVKTLRMLKWTTRQSGVKFLLKADEDVYLNLERAKGEIERVIGNSNFIVGNLICGAAPIRDPDSKYFCPKSAFKGKVYPPYVSGTGKVCQPIIYVS